MGISSNIMRVQYLALTIFSARGGIEQVSKNCIFTLKEYSEKLSYRVSVLYDKSSEEKYVKSNFFDAYSGNKIWFILKSVFIGINA